MNSDAEQDAAIKLAQERADIVAKYDKGREGAHIEPWEDADYRLYKVTDRFGFLHPEELPFHDAAIERVSPMSYIYLYVYVFVLELVGSGN
uniref:Uncharacterized protein n=1 Tax=Pelusios castaneus TaxID=367368 RepID=A0A8C8VGM9_9SAUR